MRSKLYAALAVLLIPFSAITQNLLNPLSQVQFQNSLPIPSVVNATTGGTFNFTISQFNQNLGLKHPGTGEAMQTTVWGYNHSYPGPTILAKKNVPVSVYWWNQLVGPGNVPLPHLLPVDVSLHWALSHHTGMNLGVPVVTHLHGGHTESASDGLPEAWYTPGFELKGPGFLKGETTPYYYSNDQEAATLWYHDHAMGITRLNVYAGLAGYYLLTDENEMQLQAQHKIPSGDYDIGLAIQDRMFTEDGQLYFPVAPPVSGQPSPGVLPEFFGDFILVNGAVWPVLDVEPRPYRFRLLNGSDSRFYNLWLSSGTPMIQIASDNGLLRSPVPFSQVLLGTGERKDVVIDFSGMEGQTIILRNNAKTPYPKGSTPNPLTTGRIMAFRVNKSLNSTIPKAVLPSTLRPPIVPLQTSLPARKLVLFEAMDEFGRLKPMLGTFEEGVKAFSDPITENPALNSTEIWEIYNETMDAHTIHLHLVKMQLVNRQKFMADVDPENGKPSHVRLIGNPKGPGPEEAGWKDTYIMLPGEVTRVIANFDLEGLYAWHCHILSHEDHEMMRPFYVGELPEQSMQKVITSATVQTEDRLKFGVFPNPFSSDLRMQFTLNLPTAVQVNLYDAKGSLVKKIFSGNKDAGTHQILISGGNFSNGIYFLEFISGGERVMRKLVLKK